MEDMDCEIEKPSLTILKYFEVTEDFHRNRRLPYYRRQSFCTFLPLIIKLGKDLTLMTFLRTQRFGSHNEHCVNE